jgi:hypothetical protein
MSMIVDPYNYDLEQTFKDSVTLIKEFCNVNDIPYPKLDLRDNNIGTFGTFNHKTNLITLYPRNAKTPVKVPGYKWSYTGYKADCTLPGVFAHEFGHYLDSYLATKMFNQKSAYTSLDKTMQFILDYEKPVSGYIDRFTNKRAKMSEAFAEVMKLFILNPDLLKQGRPKSYEMIISLGIVPVVTEEWTEILKNAHPKLISAANSWIKAKKAGTKKTVKVKAKPKVKPKPKPKVSLDDTSELF